MKFFVPRTKNDEQTQRVYEGIKKFAHETLGWEIGSKKIFSLKFSYKEKEKYAEVGKPDPYGGEIVMAILESNAYLICTPHRGVIRDVPFLVGKDEVIDIVYFEE